jgi:hypothetical protein
MNAKKCFSFSGFLRKLDSNWWALWRACFLLSGKIGLGALNGSGATHDPVSSLVNSESIIVMNLRSSTGSGEITFASQFHCRQNSSIGARWQNNVTYWMRSHWPQGAPFAHKLSLGWVIVGGHNL